MDEVVVRGRDPSLRLSDHGEQKSVNQWGLEIFTEMSEVAQLLDKANNSTKYQQVLNDEKAKLLDASLTPSAQILDLLVAKEGSLVQSALTMASEYRENLLKQDYKVFSLDHFTDSVITSHQAQKDIEQSDVVGFDQFLAEYFSN